LKLIFSRSLLAGNSATGHETSESFRYPFQYARGRKIRVGEKEDSRVCSGLE
jgi:hypothetical protein